MRVHTNFDHDAKAIFNAMTDPEYLVDRNLALGEISAEYDVIEENGGTTVTASRTVRRELPSMLAKLFDPVSVMDVTERWRPNGDGWFGEWVLKVRKQPVTVIGKFKLESTASGCSYRVCHEVRADVPFVFRQVRKFVMTQTVLGAEDELEYLRRYLD